MSDLSTELDRVTIEYGSQDVDVKIRYDVCFTENMHEDEEIHALEG